MNTNIIELRQADSHTVNPAEAGDYEIILNKPLLLENNDELGIKSCFIDTRSSNTDQSTGRITIDDTNDIFSVNFLLYLENYRPTVANDQEYFSRQPFTFVDQPDGKKYVVSYNNTAPANTLDCTQIQLANQRGAKFSQATIGLQYTDGSGKVVNQNFELLVNGHGSNPTYNIYSDPKAKTLNIRYKPKTVGTTSFQISDFTITNASDLVNVDKFDLASGNFSGDVDPVISNETFFPMLFNVEAQIPQGSYQADALARQISDLLSQVQMKQVQSLPIDPKTTIPSFQPFDEGAEFGDATLYNTTFPTKTPFLTSHKQLLTDGDFGLLGHETDLFLIAQDGTNILKFLATATTDYVIGTSQVGLIYDDSLNKFVFQQIHSPIIDDNTGIVLQREQPNQTPARFFTVGAHSGISFTGCGSPKTEKLLFKNMGFDASLFCNPNNPVDNATFVDNGNTPSLIDINVFATDFVAGKSTTENLISIDAFFSKTDANYFQVPALSEQTIETNNLNSIVGHKTEGGGVGSLSNGYFLIEISGLPHSNIHNSSQRTNQNQKIKSIVGRYYATSDYTTDEGQGSIPYVHQGIPSYVDKLRVRILAPDGTPATDIQNDNTVFLQLIKNKPE